MTPFRMADVRVPRLPTFSAWRSFPELNVRVYVRGPDGRDGIWFPLLLATPPTFVTLLRAAGVPYRRTHAEVITTGPLRRYCFLPADRGPWRSATAFRADVQVGQPLEATQRTPLLESLTGRWGAYHRRGPFLLRTPVQHEPWTLLAAAAEGDLSPPLTAVGLPRPQRPPVVHAARTVHVAVGVPRPVGIAAPDRGQQDRHS